MKQTLIDLFASKKFLAALTAIIVYVGGRFGLHVDPTALDHIWQALLVYVGAQGIADAGKSAAQIRAAAAAGIDSSLALLSPVTSSPAPAKSPQAGSISPGLLAVIALVSAIGVGGYALAGCGPKSTAIIDAAIDCTTQARADLVNALEPTALAAIDKIKDPTTGQITTSALQQLFGKPSLTSEAGVIVGCLESKVAALLAALLPIGSAPTPMAARASAGPPIDVTSLRKAIGEQFPGATFRTAAP